jgi:hypothetical protein
MDIQQKTQHQRAKQMFTRLTAFYKAQFPDYSYRLKDAEQQWSRLQTTYKNAIDQIKAQDHKTAADTLMYIKHYANEVNEHLVQYNKHRVLDWRLAERHFWTFIRDCKNPYVSVYDENQGKAGARTRAATRDEIHFEIGPFALQYDGGEVVVGPYKMMIDLRECFRFNLRGLEHFQGFRAVKAHEWAYSHQGKIHPHDMEWGDNKICSGEGGRQMAMAAREGRIMDVVRYATAVMSTYKNKGAYTDILVFANRYRADAAARKKAREQRWTCGTCVNEFEEGDTKWTCENHTCGMELCNYCVHTCQNCDRVTCEDHECTTYKCHECDTVEYSCNDERGGFCESCDEYFCDDHIHWCEECELYICGGCMHNCEDCEEVICRNCGICWDTEADEWVCTPCYTKRKADKRKAEEAAAAEKVEADNE